MVLPSESIERIATVPPLRDDTGSDRSMWRWDVKHRFTTRSAYDFLSHEEELEDPAIWQCVVYFWIRRLTIWMISSRVAIAWLRSAPVRSLQSLRQRSDMLISPDGQLLLKGVLS
ncbi:hypothetical protein V6N13_013178 [Hibiscus sabdariffa]